MFHIISFWFHKSKTDSFCHCLIKRRCAVQEHTKNEPGWRNSSAGTSFGLRDLRGCGERRYACQRKRTELLQPAQGPGERKQKEFLPGSLSRFPAFLAPPHLSLSLSFGCGNSSWNIKTIQSFSAEMKAPDPVDNWFPGGATIPIEPAWLPVPQQYKRLMKRQEKSLQTKKTWRVPPQNSWNYKLWICFHPFHLFGEHSFTLLLLIRHTQKQPWR